MRVASSILVVLLSAVPAAGEVLAIRATITAETRELTDDVQTGFDTSIEEFPETSPVLPMQVFAALGDLVEGDAKQDGARGLADFFEPDLAGDVNPRELGLESVCFSRDAAVRHEVESRATETRDIVLAREDLRPVGTGARNAQSTLYLSGAVLIWADQSLTDLSESAATFEIRVIRTADGVDDETLFEADLSLQGMADGDVQLIGGSGLDTLVGGAEVIDALLGAQFADVVAALESLGQVHILLLPEQTVDFDYAANPDEPFSLRVEASVTARESAGGSGVAVVFGRPFQAVPDALPASIAPRLAKRIQDAMNQAAIAATARISGEPPESEVTLCGAMGAEVLLLSLAGFSLAMIRLQRRSD